MISRMQTTGDAHLSHGAKRTSTPVPSLENLKTTLRPVKVTVVLNITVAMLVVMAETGILQLPQSIPTARLMEFAKLMEAG